MEINKKTDPALGTILTGLVEIIGLAKTMTVQIHPRHILSLMVILGLTLYLIWWQPIAEHHQQRCDVTLTIAYAKTQLQTTPVILLKKKLGRKKESGEGGEENGKKEGRRDTGE